MLHATLNMVCLSLSEAVAGRRDNLKYCYEQTFDFLLNKVVIFTILSILLVTQLITSENVRITYIYLFTS